MPRTAKPLTFGQRLRELRAAAGLTQAQLAERAGVPHSYYGDLERGRRPNPQWDTVRRLAAALGVTPNNFT